MTTCYFETGARLHVVLLLLTFGVVNGQIACRCVASNSTYLTTASPPPVTTPVAASSGTVSTTVSYNTTRAPSTGSAFILLNTSSPLSYAFVDQAFSNSTSGYTYNSSSNTFTLPAGGADAAQLVIDLFVGPTGMQCRSMPYLDQICISSNCTGCNLNQVTAAAATTLVGGSALTQRIIMPTSIVNTTVCADRDKLQSYGSFRYVVLLPLGSPTTSWPYQFRVGISGNFSTYACSTRRRRSLDTGDDDNNDHIRFDSQSILPRSRRAAVPSDCSCPVGQDPMLSSVRIVVISFEYPLRSFSATLGSASTAAYMSLARDLYYLVMNAVRNVSLSNLTSVMADFFDIEFRPGVAAGVRVTGKMTIRSDIAVSDAYLLSQLRSILPGYGATIFNLSLTSSAISTATVPTRLPDYAVALICLLSIASFTVVLIIILWRFNLIGQSAVKISSRVIQYKLPDPGLGDTRLGSNLDGAVQLPVTAYQGASTWQTADGDKSAAQDNEDYSQNPGADKRPEWAQCIDAEYI